MSRIRWPILIPIISALIAGAAIFLVPQKSCAADILGIQESATTRSPSDRFLVRWVDQGDGTWALKMSSAGGGGGGGAATIADGADVAQGATTDAAVTAGAAGTLNAHLRTLTRDLVANVGIAILPAFPAGTAIMGKVGIDQTTPGTTNAVDTKTINGTAIAVGNGVSGTGVQRVTLASDSTGQVAVASSALPTGAATAAKQPALGTAGAASADVITVQGRASMTPLLVDPSGVTSPVSAASLPLPTGASTSAKQPALGTAGAASSDVITVQGVASMTALKVDPSAVTSPVSIATAPVLVAGSAIIGKVGVDQTTPGTTNAVQFPAAALGQVASASSLSTVRASDPDLRPASGTITIQDTGSSTATGSGGVNSVITGTPTASSFQTFALNGRSAVRAQISGTWTGTIQSEVSMDGGTTYNPVTMSVLGTTQKTQATFTLIGGGFASVPGATHFRMRATAAVTGTATIQITATDAPGAVNQTNAVGLGAGSSLIGSAGIDQTTPGTTNAIDLKTVNGGTAIQTNAGASSAGALRVVVAAVAAGASLTERPIIIGGGARTANPTAVADGQSVNLMTDKMGRAAVVIGQVRDLVASADLTITSSTGATTLIGAGGASVFTDITHLTLANSSVTATLVTLGDGTNSHIFFVNAMTSITMVFEPALKGTTANTAWTLTCGTSVASLYAVTNYVKNL